MQSIHARVKTVMNTLLHRIEFLVHFQNLVIFNPCGGRNQQVVHLNFSENNYHFQVDNFSFIFRARVKQFIFLKKIIILFSGFQMGRQRRNGSFHRRFARRRYSWINQLARLLPVRFLVAFSIKPAPSKPLHTSTNIPTYHLLKYRVFSVTEFISDAIAKIICKSHKYLPIELAPTISTLSFLSFQQFLYENSNE